MDMRRVGILLVGVIVLSAGCISNPVGHIADAADQQPQVHPIEAPEAGPEPSRPEAADAVRAGNETGVAEESGSVRELPENPWKKDTVVVGVRASDGGPPRSGVVREAVAYWEERDGTYGHYLVDFAVQPNATDPDVVVEFTDTVTCQGETGWLGCAPVLRASSNVSGTQVVQIDAGYTNESTLRTLKHEFGHLLGIKHGEAPMPLMSPTQVSVTLPRTDVTNRENPWSETVVEIYVEYDSVPASEREAVERQIGRTVDYYNDGAEGTVPEDVTFLETQDRAEAEVIVTFPDTLWCENGGSGSCGQNWGYDTDDDGALEYYSDTYVGISGVATDAVGWHVGYWIGHTLTNGDADAGMPPAFNGNRTRTGDWWERA
jgi:hypothetical protein